MFERHENGYVALVVGSICALCIIALVSWTIPYSKGYQAADDNHQSAYAEHESAKEYYEKCRAKTSVEEALECLQQAENRYRDQQASEQDLDAQREMANWAEGMLWSAIIIGCFTFSVTALGVYWVKDTLDATRDAVRAADDAVKVTREIGEKQVRAYLSTKVSLLSKISAEKLDVIVPYFVVENHGQSPAKGVSVRVQFCIARSVADFREIEVVLDDICKGTSLAPSTSFSEVVTSHLPVGAIKQIEGGEFIYFLTIELSYEDVFGTRETERMDFYIDAATFHEDGPFLTLAAPQNKQGFTAKNR